MFQLTPPAKGQTQWTETVLYSFTGGNDGGDPQAGVIFGANGALYGTTLFGGTSGTSGTVFQLTPPATGQTQWTETVLHSFGATGDGSHPFAGLIFGENGALYGTTGGGRDWGQRHGVPAGAARNGADAMDRDRAH